MLLSEILSWDVYILWEKWAYCLNTVNEDYIGHIKRIKYQRESIKHYEESFPVSGDDWVDYMCITFFQTWIFKDAREKLKSSETTHSLQGILKRISNQSL
jgi:hypothetical protein